MRIFDKKVGLIFNKIILITLSVIVALFLLADVYMFIIGSLEMLPTPEQTDKARISYAIIFIILAALEFCLIKRVLRINRENNT